MAEKVVKKSVAKKVAKPAGKIAKTTNNVILSEAKDLRKSGKDSSAAPQNDKNSGVAKTAAKSDKYTPRLKKFYNDKFAKELQTELKLANIHQVPKLTKIVVSVGTGRNRENKSFQETVANTLAKITGQHATTRLAKKSIATFKIRKGLGAPVGTLVTLRGDKMWEFLDRLVNVAMPRIRDFHGVSRKAFDRQGNYSLGLVEQSIFAELSFEETSTLHGLQVTFQVANGSPEASRKLLEKFGMPFEKEGK